MIQSLPKIITLDEKNQIIPNNPKNYYRTENYQAHISWLFTDTGGNYCFNRTGEL